MKIHWYYGQTRRSCGEELPIVLVWHLLCVLKVLRSLEHVLYLYVISGQVLPSLRPSSNLSNHRRFHDDYHVIFAKSKTIRIDSIVADIRPFGDLLILDSRVKRDRNYWTMMDPSHLKWWLRGVVLFCEIKSMILTVSLEMWSRVKTSGYTGGATTLFVQTVGRTGFRQAKIFWVLRLELPASVISVFLLSPHL